VTEPVHAFRLGAAVVSLLIIVALAGSSSARAASCPTQTYLDYNHLGYAAVTIPANVPLAPGSAVGSGTIDQPASANGCKRQTSSVQVRAAGSIDPHVAVFAKGRPRIAFVIGFRCSGFAGPAYWDCLTRPLSFHGRQFTATSYPATPAPRKTLAFGARLGTTQYHGHPVTVREIEGVDPSLAVGISGQQSTAFISPTTCPYSGFSNNPRLDDLLRCLTGPVWFTFDPPGSEAGGTVVARSDRPISSAVAGASISLVPLAIAADYVPPNHGKLDPVGHVGGQVNLTIPKVPQGLYEAVVSCPGCASASSGGQTLFPAGSILVTPKPKSSPAIRFISYALAAAVLIALFLTLRTRRSRSGVLQGLTGFLMGTRSGRGGSSRR
jgi:hypothetical protein